MAMHKKKNGSSTKSWVDYEKSAQCFLPTEIKVTDISPIGAVMTGYMDYAFTGVNKQLKRDAEELKKITHPSKY